MSVIKNMKIKVAVKEIKVLSSSGDFIHQSLNLNGCCVDLMILKTECFYDGYKKVSREISQFKCCLTWRPCLSRSRLSS